MQNGWDINQYPRTRFCSEYGFQSWPSIYTIVTAVENGEDLHLDSDFVKHRQHLPFGNQFMKILIGKNLKIPENDYSSIQNFVNYIYLSQINQAVSVKIETEAYRQAKSEINSIGEGMTMGALYWQLNDVWQAPSWSSIGIIGYINRIYKKWRLYKRIETRNFKIRKMSYIRICISSSLFR